MHEYTDKKYISLAKKNNSRREINQVMDEIITDCEAAVRGFIYNMVGRREIAAELTQSTFLKVYKNINSYQPERNLKPWLFMIARRTTYDWLRRKQRRPESFIIDDPEKKFDPVDKRNSHYHTEQAFDVRLALTHLNPRYREILNLYYWKGYSYVEIAKFFNIPLNTMKTTLRRARQAVYKEICKKPKTKIGAGSKKDHPADIS